MKSSTIKILITIGVVLAGVGFLAFQSTGDVEYYVHVDQVVEHPADWLSKKTIQVHGFARHVPLKGTITNQTTTRRFELVTNGKSIEVLHEGVVPDTFKEEAETVAKGQLTKQGDKLLLTTVGGEQGIMAKCPSKYQGKR